MDKGYRMMEWLELLHRIFTRRQLADELDISTVTIGRWEKGYKGITEEWEKKFSKLANKRIAYLRTQDDYEKIMAKQAHRRLRELEGVTSNKALTKRQRANALIWTLCANRKCLYSEVKQSALEEGISPTLMSMEADAMGVVRETVGRGRHTFSVWWLKVPDLDDGRMRDSSDKLDEIQRAMGILTDLLPCKFREVRSAMAEEDIGEWAMNMAVSAQGIWKTKGNDPNSFWSHPTDEFEAE